jgi:hypothetical protein
MVFVGYETGTKGYRVYDPVTKKLQVTREVVFEEHRGWSWDEKKQNGSTETGVEVEYYSIAGRTTVTDNEEADSGNAAGQSGVAPGFSVLVPGSPTQNIDSGSPRTLNGQQNTQLPEPSTPPVTLNAPNVQFATPPTEGAVISEGGVLRYRTLQDLNDSTEEVHGFEYSGVCFVAAEEPRSFQLRQPAATSSWYDRDPWQITLAGLLAEPSTNLLFLNFFLMVFQTKRAAHPNAIVTAGSRNLRKCFVFE